MIKQHNTRTGINDDTNSPTRVGLAVRVTVEGLFSSLRNLIKEFKEFDKRN